MSTAHSIEFLIINLNCAILIYSSVYFRQMVATAKSRVTREKKGLILLEGLRLISDAIDSGIRLKAIYFSKVELLQLIPWQRAQCDLYKVQHRQLKLWSDVVTPSGVMGNCHNFLVNDLTSHVVTGTHFVKYCRNLKSLVCSQIVR